MATTDVEHLHGIVPPILTPMTPDGQVDLQSLARLTRWLISQRVHGIWACGTTGEFAALDADEREDVIGTCVEAAADRVPVVANISDCSTKLVIAHGQRALRAGAAAVAVTPPYYYSVSQDELLAHYRAVREAIDAPLFVYNIPSTVKVKVEVETVVTLAAEGTVVGTKDSQGDFDFARTLLARAAERGAALRVLLGSRLVDTSIQIGAHGCINGPANVVPRACVETYEAATRGDWAAATEAQQRITGVSALARATKSTGTAAGLGGMKAALKSLGLITHSTLTAPLRSPTPEDEARVAEVAQEIGLRVPAQINGRG